MAQVLAEMRVEKTVSSLARQKVDWRAELTVERMVAMTVKKKVGK